MILATKQTTKTGNAAAQHNKSANKNKYNTLYPLAAKRPINTANGSSNSRDQRINVDAVACGHKRRISTAIKLRSEEHTSELQSRGHLVCRLLLEKNTLT